MKTSSKRIKVRPQNAAFLALALTSALILAACLNDRNPLRAGQNGPLATPAIPHQASLRGVNHADGYCQAMDSCAACHGDDLRGGSHGEPSCFKCHEAYWTRSDCGRISHTDNLGGVFHGRGYCRPYQECAACHGTNLQGGAGGEPSCLECHTQKKWMNCGSTQHNQSQDGVKHASGFCQPQANCTPCHGADLRGGKNSEPSCTRCHGEKWKESDCGHDE